MLPYAGSSKILEPPYTERLATALRFDCTVNWPWLALCQPTWLTDRPADWPADYKPCKLASAKLHCLIDWSIDSSTGQLIGCLDGLIDWLIDWLIDCLIDWLFDWLIDWEGSFEGWKIVWAHETSRLAGQVWYPHFLPPAVAKRHKVSKTPSPLSNRLLLSFITTMFTKNISGDLPQRGHIDIQTYCAWAVKDFLGYSPLQWKRKWLCAVEYNKSLILSAEDRSKMEFEGDFQLTLWCCTCV